MLRNKYQPDFFGKNSILNSSFTEKPDVSGLSFRMSYYGYPPQLINITWSTVSNRGKHDNGKPWKYEILYRNVFRDQLCSRRNVNKVAGWCTRYSSSNKGFFSCDFTRAYTRSSHLDMHRLCCSIVVTNGFGTQTLKHPYTFSNFHENGKFFCKLLFFSPFFSVPCSLVNSNVFHPYMGVVEPGSLQTGNSPPSTLVLISMSNFENC